MAIRKLVVISFFVLSLISLATVSFGGVEEISMTFQESVDRYQFEGSFNVAVDHQVIWNVLTDYNRRSQFVTNVNCHVLERKGNDLRVEMTVGGGVLFIREEVHGLLEVQEVPLKSISFNEISHKSFDAYQGTWNIQQDPPGTTMEVTYRLEVQKNKATPGFVTPDLILQSSTDLMVEMRREMERREAKLEKVKEVHHG